MLVTDDAVALARPLLAQQARDAGIGRDRVVLDPGYDLGKTWQQTTVLGGHRAVRRARAPLMVAVSNKVFLGRLLGLAITSAGRPRWRPAPTR